MFEAFELSYCKVSIWSNDFAHSATFASPLASIVKIPQLNEFKSSFNDPVWKAIAAAICRSSDLKHHTLTRASGTENIVFFVDDSFVVKIYTPFRNGFARERSGLEFAAGRSAIRMPAIEASGNFEGFDYLVMSQISGACVTRDEWIQTDRTTTIELVHDLGEGLRELHSVEPTDINFHWDEFIRMQTESVVERQRDSGATDEWLASLPTYLDTNLTLLPRDHRTVFMHGDVHFGNLAIVRDGKKLKIAGMFDLADSLTGFHEYEFVAPGVLMIQGQGELQREFFRAYGYPEQALDEEFRTRLMLLTILYETSGLRRYAERLRPEAVNYTLYELERAIWRFV